MDVSTFPFIFSDIAAMDAYRFACSRMTLLLLMGLLAWGSAAALYAQPVPEPAPIVAEPAEIENEPAPAAQVKGEPANAGGGMPTGLVGVVEALGYWVIPFGLATLISLWFTTERVVVLRRGRVIPKPFVQRFLKLLNEGGIEKDEAMEVCQRSGSPVAQVFTHGVRKWGKPSVEVEQAIIDGGERQVSELRRHLRVINGVATITPLIGLLGTVWGMLQSFNQIAESGAMGKTSQLASGIALALVTTAGGLVIAIPSLTAYMYLSGRVDSLVMEMDSLAQSVVQNISAEAISERANSRKSSRSDDGGKRRAV